MSEQNLKNKVEAIVAHIPQGRVMTYGQLAALAGSPNAARIVGGIAHFGDSELPWHRVVNKQGGLASGYPGGRKAHMKHLEAEGVQIGCEAGNYSVDVESLIWWPPEIKRQTHKKTTLFIVGPTASGKSGLAMDLARRLNGEIVCADSQTLRKNLNIGTAKPSVSDRQEIKHHLLDVIEPYERFSVNQFKELAEAAITNIRSRGKLPIVVGGTGLYVDALYFDFNVDTSSENSDYKKELEKMSVSDLQKIIVDKKYPMPKNENNPRHLVGVILREGQLYENTKPVSGSLIIGLMPEDAELKSRIKDRVDDMFSAGLVAEVSRIMNEYGEPPEKLDAIGYPIVARILKSEIDIDTAKELFVQAHLRYARKQKSWFKRNKNIAWFKEVNTAFEYILNEM